MIFRTKEKTGTQPSTVSNVSTLFRRCRSRYNTTPHSLQRRMGVHFWIGFSNTSYLLLSLDYRSDARGNIWGIENSGYLPIHKTSGTRRRLLWFLPKYSRVAHPSEKCFVFGNLPELRLL